MSCMSRRFRRSSCLLSPRISTPSNRILPASGSMRRRMARPAVVFPQPDSPTRPSVSPLLISKLMSSTALTYAATRERTPRRIGKYFLRFLTLNRGSVASGMDATNLSYWLRPVGLAFAPLMYWSIRQQVNRSLRALHCFLIAAGGEGTSIRQMK